MTRRREQREQEQLRLIVRLRGRQQSHQEISTSAAMTAPPQQGQLPGAFSDPNSTSSALQTHLIKHIDRYRSSSIFSLLLVDLPSFSPSSIALLFIYRDRAERRRILEASVHVTLRVLGRFEHADVERQSASTELARYLRRSCYTTLKLHVVEFGKGQYVGINK